jgi:catalase
MSPAQQQALFDNTARALQGTTDAVQALHVEHCTKADAAYGAGVTKSLQAIAAAKNAR